MKTLFCDFQPNTGWRIRASSADVCARIQVLYIDGRKLMAIPTVSGSKKFGQFCNPRKIVNDVFKNKNKEAS